jgi:hypothetical protein
MNMSEVKKDSSAVPEDVSKQPEEKNSFVKKEAYEEVARDMHKYKQKAKDLMASVNEYQAQLKAQEEAKMQEQEQWKELYQKREAELEAERKKATQIESQFTRSVKVSALKQELGGKVKDDYLSHAAIDEIVVNESGSVDSESLLAVANRFRKEHGQLIPNSENTNITGHAPSGNNEAPLQSRPTTVEEMVQAYAQLKNK